MAVPYNHKAIEQKWRENWEAKPVNVDDGKKPKYYCLDMFPYPSGNGLHVGHWRGYVISDVWSRYKMMQGYYLIHPMGWDAFGLPAENYAIKMGVHPAKSTAQNIANIKRQINDIAAIYDWDREVNTTDPNFYKWTQWIFVKMFKEGLAYEKEFPINWCPSCKTGLANEEVVNGCCERCGATVTKKNLRQWMLRITKYADRLLSDLDKLDWPEKVKKMQSDWIGKSYGAEVDFKVDGREDNITVYTTRPDTLHGATFMVLAPEHKLAASLATEETKEAPAMIEKMGFGRKTVNYKLRDWVFSRQRYWGEPIPIIHCPHCGNVPVPEDQLPLTLPEVESYEPTGTGESPLAAIDEWVNTTCPVCGAPAKRETNTMPQWAGSSWYFLRYVDNKNNEELV